MYNNFMINNKRKNIFAGVFILALIIFVAFYIYNDLNPTLEKPVISSDSKPSVEEPISIDISKPSQKDGYTVKVDTTNGTTTAPLNIPKMPNLSLKITDYNRLDPAVFKSTSENIAILTKELGSDSKNKLKWLELAIYRKILGDYEASAEILNYAAVLWPNDYVIYNNLADLYQFYSKNYSLAEKNWLKTIALNRSHIDAYKNLYSLYSELYKEKSAEALPILLEGLESNPKSFDLMMSIARHYKAAGNKDMAGIYYKKAISEALDKGNKELAASIEAEAGEL
jgi:tetratricopeptide (TPR) repeat protein